MLEEGFSMVTFTTFERCDRCGAQAAAKAYQEDSTFELLFCRHHALENNNLKILFDKEWSIVVDNIYDDLKDQISAPV